MMEFKEVVDTYGGYAILVLGAAIVIYFVIKGWKQKKQTRAPIVSKEEQQRQVMEMPLPPLPEDMIENGTSVSDSLASSMKVLKNKDALLNNMLIKDKKKLEKERDNIIKLQRQIWDIVTDLRGYYAKAKQKERIIELTLAGLMHE